WPLPSKVEPWHGQRKPEPAGLMGQPWCVQSARNARKVSVEGRNRYAAEPFGVVNLVDEPTATAETAAITVGEFVPGSAGRLGFGLVVVRRVRAMTPPPTAAAVAVIRPPQSRMRRSTSSGVG